MTWFVRWVLVYGRGRRLRVEYPCATRAEARRFAREIRSPEREQIRVSPWFLGETAE